MEYFGTNLREHGHFRFDISNEVFEKVWSKFNDLPFHPENLTQNGSKGDYAYYKGCGVTAISIIGSPVDEREGTKSVFFVKEILTESEIIERIKSNKCAMAIINQMKLKFNINL